MSCGYKFSASAARWQSCRSSSWTIPLLRRQALRVTDFGAKLPVLVDSMVLTMTRASDMGLAEQRDSQNLRAVVARLPDDEESAEEFAENAGQRYVAVNPTIVRRCDEKVDGVESRLVLPVLLGDVDRHESSPLSCQDCHDTPVSYAASGWLARVFQIEMNHLDGILYIEVATKVWRPEEEDAVADGMSSGA